MEREDPMTSMQIVDPSDTLAVLRAAEAWLSDPEHWTQRELWRDRHNLAVGSRGLVHCTCALGALSYVAGATFPEYYPLNAFEALRAGFVRGVSLINDRCGHEAVMVGYRKAIEKLEATA